MNSVLRRAAGAIASAAIAFSVMTLHAPPTRASAGTSETVVYVIPDSGAKYGDALGLYATVRDISTSCGEIGGLVGCDNPDGRVDFYTVLGSTQTFLVGGALTPKFEGGASTDDTSETGPDINTDLNFCCIEPGTYVVRGYYVPGAFDPSSGDTDPLTIAKGDPSITASQSSGSTTFGQNVTFSVHVHRSAAADSRALQPTGFVSIREGTTSYGTAAIDANGDASISTSGLEAGSHTLVAAYGGDGRYETETSPVMLHDVAAGASSSTLGASSTNLTYGDPVTFTDTVSAVAPASGTPTGSVTFKDGAATIGSQPLNAGSPDQAKLSTSSLAVGSHAITASYAGDSGFDGSTSNTVIVDVAKANTSTTLGSSVNPSTFGQAVTFTANVTGPGSTTPTGTVQFRDGSVAIGAPQSVIAGVAQLTIGSLAGGSHAITAVYSGNASYNGSTSNAVAQVVTCDRTITGSVSSISVTGGSTCLSGAKLSGSVTVSGGSLSIVNSTVSGGVTVNGGSTAAPTSFSPSALVPAAPAITICGSMVAGNVLVTGEAGFVLIGDTVDDACAGNWLKGTVTLSANTGGLALADNRVGGFVKVTNNVGAGPSPHESPLIANNVISGYVVVSGNSPAATDGGRPNHLKKGQLVAI